uniref:ribosomal protein S3 n=1 Tax=Anarthria humilis TaxID=198286 RepID=UPI001F12DD0C|nr:ribosomal protein S3 [Anarthria humilis]ULQ64136.1 ribosomal protein S3 [Anarthria humilis]
MGQKINPLGFRLGTTQNHHSFWFAQPKNYPAGLQEDGRIRNCIKNYIQNYVQKNRTPTNKGLFVGFKGIICIKILKEIDLIRVIIYIGIPDFLIKEGQRKRERPPKKKPKKPKQEEKEEWYSPKGMQKLGINVQKELHFRNQRLYIAVEKVKEPYKQPKILAEYIALQIRNRVPFRKAMKKAIELTTTLGIQGIRVQLAGRLAGKEIARVESDDRGRLPLQTVSAKIDHCSYPARTIHGVLGIKIWIFIEEKKKSILSYHSIQRSKKKRQTL